MRATLSLSFVIVGSLFFLGASETVKPSLPKDHLPVPIVRQATHYSCGAAAAAAVLKYWKIYDHPEMDLYAKLGTDEKDGTDPRPMVTYFKAQGLEVRMKEKTTFEDLEKALKAGETVILDIQAWTDTPSIAWKDTWESGHYVVLIAMDKSNVFVMDPSVGDGYAYIPASELMDRWHDYEVDENGTWRNYQLAIFVKGKNALPAYPSHLTKTD